MQNVNFAQESYKTMHSLQDSYKAMLSEQDVRNNLASNSFRFAKLFQVFNFCPGIKTKTRSVEKIEQRALGDQLENLGEKDQLIIRKLYMNSLEDCR